MKLKRPCDQCPVVVMCHNICDNFFDYLDHTYNSKVTLGEEFKKKATPKNVEKIARKNKDMICHVTNLKRYLITQKKDT